MRYQFAVLQSDAGQRIIVDLVKARLARLRCRVFGWAHIVQRIRQAPGLRVAMVRLSYDRRGTLVPARSWQRGDIENFLRGLRDRMGPRLLAYAMVLELHRSGDPHYHVLILFRGILPFKPDQSGVYQGRRFKRLWPHGLTRVDFNVRTVFYIAKYTGKEYQKNFLDFPEGAHAWSVWIGDAGEAELLRITTMCDADDLWGGGHDDKSSWRFVGSALSRGYAEVLAAVPGPPLGAYALPDWEIVHA